MKRLSILLTSLFVLVLLIGTISCAKPAPSPAPSPKPASPAPAAASPSAKPATAPSPTPAAAAKPVDFPKGDITWIVPYSTGGGFDLYARAAAIPMGKILGVNIPINNIEGAGGRTGTIAAYRAKPDGYTIGIINISGLVSLEVIEPTKDYDLDKFIYLGQVSDDNHCIYVAPNSPFKSVDDLRKASRPPRFAVTGPGSATWSATIIATEAMKIPIQLVTGYKGTADISVALQRGDVDCAVMTINPFVKEIKAGTFRPLVQFLHKRHALIPNVPTSDELGGSSQLPEATSMARLVVVPPGTPQDRAQILEAALMKALKDPELNKWAETSDNPLSPLTGAEAAKVVTYCRDMFAKYKDAFEKYKK